MKARFPVLLLLFSISVCLVSAQKTKPSKPLPTAAVIKEKTVSYDPILLSGITWREVGPFRGGRSCTVTGIKGNRDLYYFGSVGGGVWRTQDGGASYENITDKYFGGTIGAVAIAPSDPNVIYVGEGEQTLRGNVSSGWGVWRSTDAGKSWTHIGLKDSRHISRIRIHPTNPDIVYVAALGNLWQPNEMRGVYKTTDGGKTWNRVLYVNDKAGAADLVMDPNNPRILYASTWNMTRNGWRMDSGGPDCHIWKSTDSGDHWEKLTNKPGLPKGTLGIIGLAVSPVNSERIFAQIEAENGGLFRSDDAGQTWTKMNDDRGMRQRAWYYTRIYADTENEDIVYICNVAFFRSKDGGKTFSTLRTPHGDHHDLWIDPDDNQRMILADDGGAQISTDGGNNWTTYHNQPTAQFYRVITDDHFPYRIYGAQQDNSSIRISHRTTGNSITERDWEPSAGGESSYLAIDPANDNVVYGGEYKGYMDRYDHETGQHRSVNIWPDNPVGRGAEVMKYRFNWNYPVMFSPHDPTKLYAGSHYLHVSYDAGTHWAVISPDLTRGEPETERSSGGPITQDNTGAEFYANILCMQESVLEKDVIYTGSDDGLLYVTRDGGKNWKNITPPTSPKYNMMNSIEPSTLEKGKVYVVATSYKFGDYTPYIYKSSDYGASWTTITSGIPKEEFARVVRADHTRKGLLYAGTEKGMWISFDDGTLWSRFQLNLPPVPIHDLAIKNDNLIAATHGRSFWMIDDITPLQQINDQVAGKSSYLYQPMPSYRMAGGEGRFNPDRQLEGQNHPGGVLIHYFAKNVSERTDAKLEILELDGDLIRAYSNKSKERADQFDLKSGGGRFVWDMRYAGYKTFPGMVFYSSPNLGPKAVPGKYKARLTVDGQVSEQEFEIIGDPRIKTTPAEYQEQFDFLISVRDKVSEAHQAILDIRKTKEDLGYLRKKFSDDKSMVERIKKFEDELTVIENNIHETRNKSNQDPINYGIKLNNRLAFLLGEQGQGDFPPTEQARQVKELVTRLMDQELKSLSETMKNNLPSVNQLIKP
ncbi:MAG: glycosyl hydrolase [Saprospiraceae bacterium]|nr:glycosyl hydrolase [Saprospiraceae bacterium]